MAACVRCSGWAAICCLVFTACSDSAPPPGKANTKPPAPPQSGVKPESTVEHDSAIADEAERDDSPADSAADAPPPSAAADRQNAPAASDEAAAAIIPPPDAEQSGQAPAQPDQRLFEGWPKPVLALVLTGEQDGYIEPCGCAGLEKQKGGLRRLHTFLKELRGRGWPVIPLDNGGLIERYGRQSEIKFDKTAEGLRIMGYQAVGFGVDDLKLSAGAITASAANGELFVSGNVGLFGLESGYVPRLRVVEAGGLKLGVTAVLGDSFQKQLTIEEEVQLMPAAEALSQVLPELEKAKCDRLVLLAHAKPDESRELAKKFPLFDVVVTAHGAAEPPHEPQRVADDGALFVEVGHKGMYAIVLGFYDDADAPVRYQRVPLDHRFVDSPEMDKLMVDYQDQLKDLGWQGLALGRVEHPRGKFAGSGQCADCHQRAYEIWRDTPHAAATETLTKAKPPRQFDPECISCHATGWNPQKYLPYATGYDSLETTPGLAGNGCENCHGPGAAHVAAEMASDEKLQEKLRQVMRRSLEGADRDAQRQSCLECHDGDNSPDFDFDTYWPKIAHP